MSHNHSPNRRPAAASLPPNRLRLAMPLQTRPGKAASTLVLREPRMFTGKDEHKHLGTGVTDLYRLESAIIARLKELDDSIKA